MPTLATVEAFATALGVSPGWLAYGIGPMELPRRRAVRAAQAQSISSTSWRNVASALSRALPKRWACPLAGWHSVLAQNALRLAGECRAWRSGLATRERDEVVAGRGRSSHRKLGGCRAFD